MATTETLETYYWPGHRQSDVRTKGGRGVRRVFRVPRIEYDNLAPAVNGTVTDAADVNLVVVNVERAEVPSVSLVGMAVTYEKIELRT